MLIKNSFVIIWFKVKYKISMISKLNTEEEFWQLPARVMNSNNQITSFNSQECKSDRYESKNKLSNSAVRALNCNDSKSSASYSNKRSKKRAKTYEEVKFLEEMYEKDPTWSRKTVQIWKQALNLKTNQIYKWGYDRKKLSKEDGISKYENEAGRNMKLSEEAQIQNPNDLVQCIVSAKANYFKKTHLSFSGEEVHVIESGKLKQINNLLDNTDNLSMLSMMNNFCEVDSTKVTLNDLSKKINQDERNDIFVKETSLTLKLSDDFAHFPLLHHEVFTSKHLRTDDNDFSWFTPTSAFHNSMNQCDNSNDVFSLFLS